MCLRAILVQNNNKLTSHSLFQVDRESLTITEQDLPQSPDENTGKELHTGKAGFINRTMVPKSTRNQTLTTVDSQVTGSSYSGALSGTVAPIGDYDIRTSPVMSFGTRVWSENTDWDGILSTTMQEIPLESSSTGSNQNVPLWLSADRRPAFAKESASASMDTPGTTSFSFQNINLLSAHTAWSNSYPEESQLLSLDKSFASSTDNSIDKSTVFPHGGTSVVATDISHSGKRDTTVSWTKQPSVEPSKSDFSPNPHSTTIQSTIQNSFVPGTDFFTRHPPDGAVRISSLPEVDLRVSETPETQTYPGDISFTEPSYDEGDIQPSGTEAGIISTSSRSPAHGFSSVPTPHLEFSSESAMNHGVEQGAKDGSHLGSFTTMPNAHWSSANTPADNDRKSETRHRSFSESRNDSTDLQFPSVGPRWSTTVSIPQESISGTSGNPSEPQIEPDTDSEYNGRISSAPPGNQNPTPDISPSVTQSPYHSTLGSRASREEPKRLRSSCASDYLNSLLKLRDLLRSLPEVPHRHFVCRLPPPPPVLPPPPRLPGRSVQFEQWFLEMLYRDLKTRVTQFWSENCDWK